MKRKLIIFLLIYLISVLVFNIKSYAVTPPHLMITSNNYSVGDKLDFDTEINVVEVGKTLQLYALTAHGNEMPLPDNPDSTGWFVDEINLSGVTWSSSDRSIAIVNNSGKVTGISEGTVTITATYNEDIVTCEITVNPYTGIWIATEEPEPAKILGQNYEFSIFLYNIPDTEKENIEVTIDNENIAQLTSIDLCDGQKEIKANVKFLSLGNFKITATLNYNGETYYSDELFTVVESASSLSISTKDFTDLPSSINIGDKIQLTAWFEIYGSSLIDNPKDVTTKGVTWTSSDEKIVKVTENGLLTAIGKGQATITATYKIGDETLTATYVVKVNESSVTPVNPGNKNDPTVAPNKALPNTGIGITIALIGSIILITICGIAVFSKYKKVKDVN